MTAKPKEFKVHVFFGSFQNDYDFLQDCTEKGVQVLVPLVFEVAVLHDPVSEASYKEITKFGETLYVREMVMDWMLKRGQLYTLTCVKKRGNTTTFDAYLKRYPDSLVFYNWPTTRQKDTPMQKCASVLLQMNSTFENMSKWIMNDIIHFLKDKTVTPDEKKLLKKYLKQLLQPKLKEVLEEKEPEKEPDVTIFETIVWQEIDHTVKLDAISNIFPDSSLEFKLYKTNDKKFLKSILGLKYTLDIPKENVFGSQFFATLQEERKKVVEKFIQKIIGLFTCFLWETKTSAALKGMLDALPTVDKKKQVNERDVQIQRVLGQNIELKKALHVLDDVEDEDEEDEDDVEDKDEEDEEEGDGDEGEDEDEGDEEEGDGEEDGKEGEEEGDEEEGDGEEGGEEGGEEEEEEELIEPREEADFATQDLGQFLAASRALSQAA